MEGTWVGTAEVEIVHSVILHELELELWEGTSQTGERTLEGVGLLTRGSESYEVELESPWRGRRIEAQLEVEEQPYVFGVTEFGQSPGGGTVRPNIDFTLEGRIRGQRLRGKLVVEEQFDIWRGDAELERQD